MGAFQALRSAMNASLPAGSSGRWGDLMMELWPAISSPLTVETERVLLEILRFEGRLQIDLSSEMPHSMPPEDMLKSLAIQALARWTGLAHLQEMHRVDLTTTSASLSSLITDVIERAPETEQAMCSTMQE